MDDLMDILIAEERLRLGNALLQKHGRDDLKIIAVNRMYDWSFVCLEGESIYYYLLCPEKIRREGSPNRGFGTNFIITDPEFEQYESIPLTNKRRQYTSCARYELVNYLKEGWFPEN